MKYLEVRCLPDRLAYDAPRGGKLIPTDRWVSVPLTAWINRLVNHHGDIEVLNPATGEAAKAEAAEPAKSKRARNKPSSTNDTVGSASENGE